MGPASEVLNWSSNLQASPQKSLGASRIANVRTIARERGFHSAGPHGAFKGAFMHYSAQITFSGSLGADLVPLKIFVLS